MEKPLVSIIIPCYNSAAYIEETLSAVLNQTYTNWEAIIVNDGSTDNTNTVVEKWLEQDVRFKYFSKQNEGLAKTRIFGIDKSKGKYILPLDSDDIIKETYLAKTVNVLERDSNVEVVTTKVRLFGAKNKLFNLNDYSLEYLLIKNCIVATSLFRKESYDGVGGYCSQLTSLEDWDLWISLLKNGGKVYKVEEELFHYRIHSKGSLINNLFKDPNKYKEYHNIIFKRHSDAFLRHIGNPILIKRDLDNLKAQVNKPLQVKFINALKKVYAKILGK